MSYQIEIQGSGLGGHNTTDQTRIVIETAISDENILKMLELVREIDDLV